MNRDNQRRTSLEEIRQGASHVLRDLEGLVAGEGGQRVAVVEHLRLRVPAASREAWLQAELQTWDPWLRQQQGFVGREVRWDSDRQEGVLLIHWANHHDWKAIAARAVAVVQESFESVAKDVLALHPHSDNPFPLEYSGEVYQP